MNERFDEGKGELELVEVKSIPIEMSIDELADIAKAKGFKVRQIPAKDFLMGVMGEDIAAELGINFETLEEPLIIQIDCSEVGIKPFTLYHHPVDGHAFIFDSSLESFRQAFLGE